MSVSSSNSLVVKGRSVYYLRDGLFVLAVAGVFALLQVLVVLIGVARGLVVPFGACFAAAVLVGVGIVIAAHRSVCCAACRAGLVPSDYAADASALALEPLCAALADRNADGFADIIHDHPRDMGVRVWTRAHLSYCPNCVAVAKVAIEQIDTSWRASLAVMKSRSLVGFLAGEGVRRVLSASTTRVGE